MQLILKRKRRELPQSHRATFLVKYSPNCQERSSLGLLYLWERLSENSVPKLFVHDHETTWSGEKLAHFSKSYLVACEDKDIESDVLAEDALDERIVVFFSICEIGDVLPLTQLFRWSHLLLKIWTNRHSWATRAWIPNQVHYPCRQDGYFSHADRNIDSLTQTTVLSLTNVNISLGSQIFDPGDDVLSILTEGDNEAFVDIWRLRLRVIFNRNSNKIHDLDNVVLFSAIDAVISVDLWCKFVDMRIATICHKTDIVLIG